MEIVIATMSLSDLLEVRKHIEEKLDIKEQWMNAERGHDYQEYCKREQIYNADSNHEKLKRLNARIEEYMNAV